MAVDFKALFTHENFVHAAAGAVGSMVGMTVFYPLDTVRCRLQLEEKRKAKNTLAVIRDLIAHEGVPTLYRGIIPVLQSLCASNFVYFYVYHGLKNSFRGRTDMNLLLASIAGAVNVLVTGPLWLVNTRMKMAGITEGCRYDSLLDGLKKISCSEGCGTLWSGTVPSLILVSSPAIHMAVYEYLKRKMKAPKTALTYFVLSGMAKAAATIATYPIQLAQARLRAGHTCRNIQSSIGMIPILIHILKNEGPAGLYKGMEAKLLQTVLTTALMFMCYEKIAIFVMRILK